MNDNNTNLDKIRNEDKRAFPKFVIVMLLAMAVGMVMGFASALLAGYMQHTDLDIMTIGKVISDFWVVAGRYLIIIGNVIILPLLWFMLNKGRKALKAWDGEDEEVYECIDKKLSTAMSVSGVTMIFDMLTYGIAFYGAFSGGKPLTLILLVDLVVFIGSIFYLVFWQKSLVNLLKEYNPEKQGSVLDMKFTKKWMESCDEAEKQKIGEASYSTYTVMNLVYEIFIVILMIAGFVLPIGVIPLTVVCVLWMVQMIIYSVKSR